jgi:hypothetical protein
VIVVISIAIACNINPLRPQTRPESGEILFQDDFKDVGSGWHTSQSEDGFRQYQVGGFRIYISEANTYQWTIPGRHFADAHVQVSVSNLAGDVESDFGLICRYQDERNFYALMVNSQGHFGIIKFKDGKEILLVQDHYGYDERAIRTGQAQNDLKASCWGKRLTLYANETMLMEVFDEDFTAGDIGLIAGTYQQPGADLLFSDLIVSQP